jgi:hypothetical protein
MYILIFIIVLFLYYYYYYYYCCYYHHRAFMLQRQFSHLSLPTNTTKKRPLGVQPVKRFPASETKFYFRYICYKSPNICTIRSPLYYLFTFAYMFRPFMDHHQGVITENARNNTRKGFISVFTVATKRFPS